MSETRDILIPRFSYPSLRMVTDQERTSRRLISSHLDFGLDDDIVFEEISPKVVEIRLEDSENTLKRNKGCKPFQRQLLISIANQNVVDVKIIVTMSGYLYSGSIQALHDFDKKRERKLPEDKMKEIRMIRAMEIEHVNGFDKENDKQNFDIARSKHQERIKALDLQDISMEKTLKIYETLIYCLPHY